jgi:CRISPR-associated protein Cmr6
MEGNIGMQFYRGYYQDYFGSEGLRNRYIKDKDEKEELNEANRKNNQFAQYRDISLNKKLRVGGTKFFPLTTIYPGLYTGSGYTFGAGLKGEFQLGFLFDHTTGLPYLPGSSIKGAIRSVFPNYDVKSKKTENKEERVAFIWEEYFKKMTANCFTVNFSMDLNKKNVIADIELEIFDGRNIALEKQHKTGEKEEYLSIYRRDIFYDAYIAETVKRGETRGRFLGTDYITPHESPTQNPTPLPFLKILPGVTVNFQFRLHDGYYLTAKGKEFLFRQILLDFGVGAKTNVGYGQFAR